MKYNIPVRQLLPVPPRIGSGSQQASQKAPLWVPSTVRRTLHKSWRLPLRCSGSQDTAFVNPFLFFLVLRPYHRYVSFPLQDLGMVGGNNYQINVSGGT